MKKIVCIILILLIAIMLLMFCSDHKTVYPLSQERASIAKIELVKIEHFSYASAQYYDDIIILATIDRTKYDTFLSDFYNLECKKSLAPPENNIVGLCVRFTYNDSSYELISSGSALYCSADKVYSYPDYYFDYDIFNEFINSWQSQS